MNKPIIVQPLTDRMVVLDPVELTILRAAVAQAITRGGAHYLVIHPNHPASPFSLVSKTAYDALQKSQPSNLPTFQPSDSRTTDVLALALFIAGEITEDQLARKFGPDYRQRLHQFAARAVAACGLPLDAIAARQIDHLLEQLAAEQKKTTACATSFRSTASRPKP